MFASKYPAFAALLALLPPLLTDFEATGTSFVQKLEGAVVIVPGILAFIPQASQLGAEVAALKASPSDLEAGAELLVTDLAFSSTKAQAIITAAFPLAESLVALAPQISALVGAIKS